MSRPILLAVLLLVLVAGGLFLLAGRSRERPTTRVEQSVSLANLS